jgi:hypothetical protein
MISKVLRHLLFLPSITFGAISSEIFPWAAIYSSIYVKFKKVSLINVFLIFLVTGYILGSIYFFFTPPIKIFSATAAYFNVFLTFIVFLNLKKPHIKKIIKTTKTMLIVFLFFGLFQLFGATSFLQETYTFLIPRGNFGSLEMYGRGVSILTTEPSRASMEIIFMSLFLRKFIKSKRFLFDVVIILFVNLVVQGGYALLYSLLYLIVSVKIKFYKFLFPFLILGVIAFYDELSAYRGYYIISRLLQDDSFLETLVALSGFRVLSFFASWNFTFINPLGGGLGNWQVSSLEALNLTSFDPTKIPYFIYNCSGKWCEIKPTSIFGNVLLDFGFVGGLILLIFAFFYLRNRIYIYKTNYDVYFVFLVYFFVFGYLGHPIPIFILAICLNKNFGLLHNNG